MNPDLSDIDLLKANGWSRSQILALDAESVVAASEMVRNLPELTAWVEALKARRRGGHQGTAPLRPACLDEPHPNGTTGQARKRMAEIAVRMAACGGVPREILPHLRQPLDLKGQTVEETVQRAKVKNAVLRDAC